MMRWLGLLNLWCISCASAFAASKKKSGFGGGSTVKKKRVASPQPKPPVLIDPPNSDSNGINVHGSMPQFMGAYLIKDDSIVDGVMSLFEATPQTRGMISAQGGTAPIVDTSVKDSLEISVSPNDPRPEWQAYIRVLNECIKAYLQQYPFAAAYGKFGLVSRTNIQRYPPGGGYKTFHTERTGAGEPEGSRHLVFMTYLNTLTDAGGTEFFHQQLVTQPVKGLTLVWPAGWEFTHRGVPSPTEEKTITTGWFNYI